MTEQRLRVVFAEDSYLVRAGTAALLAEIDEIELVEMVDSLPALLDAVDRHRPDAVLTDIRMPPSHTNEGIVATVAIRARYPDVGVVLLSQYVVRDYVRELLDSGAAGIAYLLKERVRDVGDLLTALRTARAGGLMLDPSVVAEYLALTRRAPESPLARLAGRERDVLEQMAMGRANASIARTLFLSERSVERHINSIFAKLGLSEEPDVNRRVKAVLTFLES